MPAHNARRRGDRSGRRMCRLATELNRKLERDVFGARSKRRDLGDAMRPEPVAHPDEELLGCRGPGGEPDGLVAGMANQNHAVACIRETANLNVHFLHEWTRRVYRREAAGGSSAIDLGRDAVRGENEPPAPRDGRFRLDEDGAPRLQVAHDVSVVDDLFANVDRRSVDLERSLHRLDRSLDAGAVASVRGDEHALHHSTPPAGADCDTPMCRGNQSTPDPASPCWDDVSARAC